LSHALAASVCTVCSGPHPLTRHAGHCYMLVNGPIWAPARLEMHLQPSVQSAHASRGLSGLCARSASDSASDQCLRGKHTSAMHARSVPDGFMPRCPRIACLYGCVNLFTLSLVLCLLTSVYKSVVTSWRPTRPTRDATMPRRALWFPQTSWCIPHTDGCEVYMPHLVGAVLVLCAPCAQVPSPRSAALQPDYTSISGSRSDPTSQVIL
jgi:hypothetical protein